ncbi:MAG: B12-binding domain-containing radical SAM protein [Candidatus Binatia bacterium]
MIHQQISIALADLLHPGNVNKTFPYAAGCIAAFTARALQDQAAIEVYRTPEDLGDACGTRMPEAIGFSNYVWNLELTYEVIRQLKAAAPAVVTIVGGPNYPTAAAEQRAFLTRYPLVDFYVYKEGEEPFLALIEALRAVGFDAAALKRQRPALAAVHYLADGEAILTPPAARQRALDEYPSPYLTGMLDKFFERRDLVPLTQTKRGCPFQCTFCVEGEDYYTKVGSVSTARFRAELEYMAARAGQVPPVLQIADSNFGMYADDLEMCDAIAAIRAQTGWPQTVEVSTGKNRKERVLEAVRRTNGAMRFGPALQSTDKQTLENVKRSNISENILMEMASAATDLGQRSYTELILNLPGDTIASHLRTIRAAMEAGMQRIKMYALVLLPGTEMASDAGRRQFGLRTRFRIFPYCHGTYRFMGPAFPSVEIAELVVATDSMSFDDYMYCKAFELSVEIFYNDIYLPEIHGLTRALGVSMFDFVERCHAQFDAFPAELRELYAALAHGVRDNLFDTRDACLAHYRDPAHLEAYAREEYKNSLGMLKAVALLEQIEPVLAVARTALRGSIAAAGIDRPGLAEYIDELTEFSRLRRRHILDTTLQPEGDFRFAFDRIMARDFAVDPAEFRLAGAKTMRFWHDDEQARDIRKLCREVSNPILRARSFIYPPSDPGVNPYLRRSGFC